MSPHLPREPAALLFAPLIYVAWADGDLDAAELGAIRDQLDRHGGLPDAARAAVDDWLDPQAPPTAADLAALLGAIRSNAGERHLVEGASTFDIQSLAESLATGAGHRISDEERAAVAELVEALGVTRAERAAHILESVRPPPLIRPHDSGVDVDALAALLAEPRAELRAEVAALIAEPAMRREPELDRAALRASTQRRLQPIADRGWGALAYPRDCGGAGDPEAFLAVFETLGLGDLNVLVKYGVQFGLFGLAIQMLGTERHHRELLPRAGRLELAGCFAMTETAHGSNVAELETTAIFDPASGELVIDTPHARARKDYIGNAAHYAEVAVVFAQLETLGQRHGVHAFVVPIRDADGVLVPGVLVEDCGDKLGLDGVDNGRLSFSQVRVGRDALLDRFASLDAEGNYASDIASPARRFFTMLGTLVGGRVAVSAAAVSAAKVALAIAVRYAHRRRQFGPSGSAELRLIDYPHHRRRLMIPLARTLALHAASRELAARFVAAQDRGEPDRELETAAAAIKALATANASAVIGECREACGGRGYLADARFGELKADTDVFTTFEGDNVVLLQLVARSLLSGLARGMKDLGVLGLARHVARRARAAFDRNPYTARRTDDLGEADVQERLLAGRADDLLHSLARRLKKRIDGGADAFSALIDCQDHAVALARAHAERVVFDAVRALEARGGADLAEVLAEIRGLYALAALETDRGWFLENGYFEPSRSGAVRDQVEALCASLAGRSLHVIDALAIPDALLGALGGGEP